MKLWVVALLIVGFVALGGIVGMLAGRDPGYVLIAYNEQSIETSLWLALILLGVLFAVLVVTGLALLRLLQSRVALGRWSKRRQIQVAEERTVQGMLLLYEAEWSEAKRALSTSAEDAPVPLLNYLCAARAAHALGERKERDRLLVLAERSQPDADFGVQLAHAEMLCESAEWPGALKLLEHLKSRAPRHPRVLSLLARAYVATSNWRPLAQLLPGMRKARTISNRWVDTLTRDAACAELDALPAEPESRRERELLWKRLPRALHTDAILVLALARCAERQNDLGAVAPAIEAAVSKLTQDAAAADRLAEPLQELVALYGSADSVSASERAGRLRSWLDCRATAAPAQLAQARLRLLAGDTRTAQELLEGVGDLTLRAEQRTARTAALELARVNLAQGAVAAAADALERGFAHLRPVSLAAVKEAAAKEAAVTREAPLTESAAKHDSTLPPTPADTVAATTAASDQPVAAASEAAR